MYDIADSNHTLTTVIDKHGLFLFNAGITVNTSIVNHKTGQTIITKELNNIKELILFNKKVDYSKSTGTIYNRNEHIWEEKFEEQTDYVYNTVRLTFHTLSETIT